MKNTKRLMILVGLIFVAGLFFTVTDSYAETELPGYVQSESSSQHIIPAGVTREAMKERFKRYLEFQNEALGKPEYDSSDFAEKLNREPLSDSIIDDTTAGSPDEEDGILLDKDALGGYSGCPGAEPPPVIDPEPEPEPTIEPEPELEPEPRPDGEGLDDEALKDKVLMDRVLR